jgi:dTDP-4-dehydrorhamnose 3,5-epimerase
MEFIETKLKGVYIIEQNVFQDSRGGFVKTFQEGEFRKRNLEYNFKENYYTESKKNVIRGMHFQSPPCCHAKLVTVIKGLVIDVVLDLREGSDTFQEFVFVKLSRKNRKSVYIPKGCAHGFGVLSDFATTYYMTTSEHAQNYDAGIKYDSFGFDWNIKKPIISDRDGTLINFSDFKTPFV